MENNAEAKPPRRPRHRNDNEAAREDGEGERGGVSIRLVFSIGMMVIGVIMAIGYSAVAFDTGTAPSSTELETLIKALGEVFKIILSNGGDN